MLLPTYNKLTNPPTPTLKNNLLNKDTKKKFNILPPNESIAEAKAEVEAYNKSLHHASNISYKRNNI